MTAIRLDPIDDDRAPAERLPGRSLPARSRIRWGDVAAFAVVLAASVLFVVLFSLIPILGAPD